MALCQVSAVGEQPFHEEREPKTVAAQVVLADGTRTSRRSRPTSMAWTQRICVLPPQGSSVSAGPTSVQLEILAKSAADEDGVSHEGRTFSKVSRLRSSSRIRRAPIADASEREAVDASGEESITTAGQTIFVAAFNASSKGSPPATETFARPSVTSTTREDWVAKE